MVNVLGGRGALGDGGGHMECSQTSCWNLEKNTENRFLFAWKFVLKGTVSVIDPPCKYRNAWFTMVTLKPLSEKNNGI